MASTFKAWDMPAIVQHVHPADIASVRFYGLTRTVASAKPLAAYDLDVMIARHAAELHQNCGCTAIDEAGVRAAVRDVNDGNDAQRNRDHYLRVVVIRFARALPLPIGGDPHALGPVAAFIITSPPLIEHETLRTAVWVGRHVHGHAGLMYAPVFVSGDPMQLDAGDAAVPLHWNWYSL
jgi:hypothetical protein